MKKSIRIPFLLEVILDKANYGLQGSFSIRILIFSFHIGLYYGLGWSISSDIDKWLIELRIHLKRIAMIFTIGIPLYSILHWKANRLYKKMTPEKKRKFREIIEEVLGEPK